jgi:hypothetical protein
MVNACALVLMSTDAQRNNNTSVVAVPKDSWNENYLSKRAKSGFHTRPYPIMSHWFKKKEDPNQGEQYHSSNALESFLSSDYLQPLSVSILTSKHWVIPVRSQRSMQSQSTMSLQPQLSHCHHRQPSPLHHPKHPLHHRQLSSTRTQISFYCWGVNRLLCDNVLNAQSPICELWWKLIPAWRLGWWPLGCFSYVFPIGICQFGLFQLHSFHWCTKRWVINFVSWWLSAINLQLIACYVFTFVVCVGFRPSLYSVLLHVK